MPDRPNGPVLGDDEYSPAPPWWNEIAPPQWRETPRPQKQSKKEFKLPPVPKPEDN